MVILDAQLQDAQCSIAYMIPNPIVMEALNAMFGVADNMGLLFGFDDKVKERAFLYADDVVIFLSPRKQDLVIARSILELFGQATGLRTNGCKCLITPIHCDLEDTVTKCAIEYDSGAG